MRKLLLALLFAAGGFAQTLPTALQVTRVFGITSATQVLDNRSTTRQCNYFSYNVTTGTGAWAVQLEYADVTPNGPWTSFGTSGAVTNANSPSIGFGNGYHDFVRLNTTAGTSSSILSCEKDFFIPASGSGGGSVQFPILISQGGTGAVTATGATQNLQYLGPQPGASARSVQSKLSDAVSVFDFPGCDPTGTSDSTICLQTALNVSSGYPGNNTSLNLYVPPGVYVISSTLTYFGNQSKSLIFQGAGFGPGSTVIRWNGPAGGTMLSLTGMSGSKIEGLDFDGNGLAKIGIENNSESNAGHPVSTGDVFSALSFENFVGSSVDLVFGNNATDCPSEQLDSMTVRDSVFSGTTGTGIGIQCGGAVKNFRMERNQISGFTTGISSATSAGTYVKLDSNNFSTNTNDIAFTAGTLTVLGGASTGSAAFLTLGAPASSVPTSATVQGFAWNGCQSGCTGDVIITNYGALTLNANEFDNLRTGSSLPLIQTAAGARTTSNNSGSSILSTNNFYLNASNAPGGSPFQDTTGFCLVDSSGACSAGSAYRISNYPLAFVSVGDRGGTSASEIPLTAQRPNGGFQSFTQLLSATLPGSAAQSGVIGLAAADAITQRNAANNGDINVLSKNSIDQVVLGDTPGAALQGPLALSRVAGSGGVVVNTLVALDSSANVVSLTGGAIPLGIAGATVAAGTSVPVSIYGIATCISDNTAVIGHIAVGGTVTANRCSDSGQTSQSGIASTTALVGIILTNAAGAGQSISVQLFGPGDSGAQPNTGTTGVSNIATTTPITGGPITATGTIACPTCTTAAAALTSGRLLAGAAGQAIQLTNLSGDATTSGTAAVTVVKINGTTVPVNSASDQALITNASATGLWASLPNCLDSAGQHLNYNTSTHALSCGTTTSGVGSVTNVTGTAPITSTGGATPAIACPTCGTAAGTLTSGQLLIGAGAKTLQTGNLSGDVTTAGGVATTVVAINGTSVPINAATDQTLLTTSIGNGVWTSVSACLDTAGNHLNYNSTTHTFLCGTSAAAAVTSIATTGPITGGTITSTGTIACATCNTSASSLTSGQLLAGAGSQAIQTTNLSGDVTTSGSAVTTDLKINGTTVPVNSAADQALLTSGSAVGVWSSVPLCIDSLGQHLNYNTATHLFSCGTTSAPSANGFNTLTSGTNTQAAMLVGTGATLGPTGSGTISANRINGSAAAASATTDTTNATNITTGTLGAAEFPAFTGDTTTSAGSVVTTTGKVNGTTVPINSAADQFLGTTASATGAWASVPGCLDAGGNHLNYNTSTHLFSCGTSGGTAGSAAFNTITSGTNASAAMVVGTGSSLTTSGAGTINANLISGLSPAASATTDTTVATNISSGTLGAARLPAFTGDTTSPSGSSVNTTVKVNGTSVPVNSAADQTILTTASATGSWASLPLCLDSGGNHLNYNTTTHAFACGTSGGTAGSAAFNTITTGSNTQAAMTVGTGASLAPTGAGTISANLISGLSPAASATTDTTVATNISSGTLGAARLPAFTGDTTTSAGSSVTTTAKVNGTTVPVNSAGDQFLGTTASAAGAWASMPLCLDSTGQHLNYNTSTHTFSCGTSQGTGSAAFSSLTSGTNTQAAMLVGTGGSLGPTGSGTIAANQVTLTGDVTSSAGLATTLATVNSGPGACGDATHVCAVTTNGKGLVTAQTATSIAVGTVTSIATTGPITGGTITATGTIACATCNTSAGSLASGQILVGGGGQAIQTGNLSGDVTTSGSAVSTVVKIDGTTVPVNSAADQALVTTASATAAWTSFPGCLDSGGNHLNYNTSTHVFSCGTTGGGAQFNTLTSGTNTAAAMLVGSGATLLPTGTGVISANQLNGTSLAGLTTGLLKNTAATGIPSIALAGTDYDLPVTASLPLLRTANNFNCPTCATTTNGGALTATAPVTVSAAGVIACANCSTAAGTLTSAQLLTGGGGKALQSADLAGDVTTTGTNTTTALKIHGTTVPVNSLADQFLGTTGAAVATWASVPNCLDSAGQHLNYTTATHLFSCGTTGGGAGSAAFSSLTSGTNTTATMLVGSGSSLGATGTGTVVATSLAGAGPFSLVGGVGTPPPVAVNQMGLWFDTTNTQLEALDAANNTSTMIRSLSNGVSTNCSGSQFIQGYTPAGVPICGSATSGGPSITSGSTVPTGTCILNSVYNRTGTSGNSGASSVFICSTDGTTLRWTAITGHQLNVMTFGCKADGVTNDQACIQTAVNVAGILNQYPAWDSGSPYLGSDVFFPCGDYAITSPIVLPRVQQGGYPQGPANGVVGLVGESPTCSVIQGNSGSAWNGVTGVFITNPGAGYTSVPSVSFSGGCATEPSATAILQPGTTNVSAVYITTVASGCTATQPTCTISGGGGSGATCETIGHGMIEWASIPVGTLKRVVGQTIKNFRFKVPQVDGTVAIHYQISNPPNNTGLCNIGGNTVCERMEGGRFDHLEFEDSNDFNPASILFAGDCNTCEFSNLNNNPALGTKYQTPLIATNIWAPSILGESDGLQYGKIINIGCGGEKNGSAPCFLGRLQRNNMENAFCDGIRNAGAGTACYAFYNSSNAVLTNVANEGGAGYQMLLQNSRHFLGFNIGMATPSTQGGQAPLGGLYLVQSSNNRFTGHEAGGGTAYSGGIFRLFTDAQSYQNQFLDFEIISAAEVSFTNSGNNFLQYCLVSSCGTNVNWSTIGTKPY